MDYQLHGFIVVTRRGEEKGVRARTRIEARDIWDAGVANYARLRGKLDALQYAREVKDDPLCALCDGVTEKPLVNLWRED